jgi:hypothetical protein
MAGLCQGWLRGRALLPVRPLPLKARVTMSEDDRKTLAELAITGLERAADEYGTMAATASTTADRDSHTRVADGLDS